MTNQKERTYGMHVSSHDGHRMHNHDITFIVLEDRVAYSESFVPWIKLDHLVGIPFSHVIRYIDKQLGKMNYKGYVFPY